MRRSLLRRRGHITMPADAASSGKLRFLPLILALGLVLTFLTVSGIYLRDLSSRIAVSDASDAVSAEINRVIARVMEDQDSASFVSFEKNEAGEIVAVNCNMQRINSLSAEILDQVVGEADNRTLTVRIPLGNLTGVNLLMGRGPGVPVEIVMLTSSRVRFDNSILSAGINQTKHRITLLVSVDIDVLIPWGTRSARVESEVLIADTTVIGQVPGTYMSF